MNCSLLDVSALRLQMPRNVFEETKYLEIMIVSDHNLVCTACVPSAAAATKRYYTLLAVTHSY